MLELMWQILSILGPGMILALMGWVWGRQTNDYPVNFVTTLVLNLGLPALLFHTLSTASVSVEALSQMALAAVVVHLVFALLASVYLRFAKKDWRLVVPHVVGNTGNLGLPICFFAFGEEGLAFAMAFFAVQCLIMFSVGEAILAGHMDAAKLLRSPILLAVVAGTAVRWFTIPLPTVVLDTSMLLGQLVIPIMLITLGVSLHTLRTHHLAASLWWSLVRTVVAIIIGFAVAESFGFTGAARGVLVLQTVVPVAVFNFLLTMRHGRDSSEVAGLILVTHLGAIFYLPLVLGLLLI